MARDKGGAAFALLIVVIVLVGIFGFRTPIERVVSGETLVVDASVTVVGMTASIGSVRVSGSGGPFTYTYSWGDGAVTTGEQSQASESHAYATAGAYNIVLKATDPAGKFGSWAATISVPANCDVSGCP
jgi:chitodextrinase